MTSTTLNSKSTTMKRIMREAAELSTNPSLDYHAAPLENNLFEWHFTLRGPSESPFSAGIYHGRITLPTQYPLRPPSFRFLTPSGRFECNREICLSISGFHEETWQPAWGVRTAILALRSHMDVPAKGQVGGIDSDEQTRRRWADMSAAWTCATCARSNGDILKEQIELVKRDGVDAVKAEEKAPEDLRLVYREDLTGESQSRSNDETQIAHETPVMPEPTAIQIQSSSLLESPGTAAAAESLPVPLVPMQSQVQPQDQPRQPEQTADDVKLDAAIWLLSALLALLVARWLVKFM